MQMIENLVSGTSLPSLETAYVIVIWAIRLGMIVTVPLRRSPQAAASWLLLIFFLPIPGLLIYLNIGRRVFPKCRAERFARLAPFFAETTERMAKATPLGHRISQDVVDLAIKLSGLPAVDGNMLEFLDDYDGIIIG
jgi:cardiolipin synthase